MLAQLESMMAELCFGPELDADDPEAFAALLTRHHVGEADREYLLSQDQARLLVYRELVQGTLWEAMRVSIPRTMSRLGDVFDEYFHRFLAERGTRTHYLRDATRELLDFCEPLWAEDRRVPGYAAQLGRHEYVQIEIGSKRARTTTAEPEALELDAPVAFIEAIALMQYDYALHLLSDDPDDRREPEPIPTWLLVYRNPEHEVRYLSLTPLAHGILRRLVDARATLREAIVGACQEHAEPLTERVLEGSARLLADLAERGALIGREPSRPKP